MKQKKTLIALFASIALVGLLIWKITHRRITPITLLEITEINEGKGELAMMGKKVKIHYNARTFEGQNFDSSYGKSPLTFRLGNGETIPGFEQGIPGMKVGGKRRLTMPPNMGFGPLNTKALIFEVELIDSSSR